MKLLGIDYGTKRIGLAVSDDSAKLAFPYSVIKNTENYKTVILSILKKENIKEIVIGESKDFEMKDNPIMKDVNDLKETLETNNFKVFLEPEYFSTVEASRIKEKDEMIDARAAAIILQSYLDKQKNNMKDKISYEDYSKIEKKIGKKVSADKNENSDKL